MRIELTVNGAKHALEVEPRTTLLDCLRDMLGAQGRACRLRARRLRRLHRAVRRRRGALLPDVRARRRTATTITTIEGVTPGARRTVADPGRLLRNPRHAMRLLHAGHDPRRARAARRQSGADARGHRRGDLRQSSAAAPAMRRSSRRSRSPPSACAAPTGRRSRAQMSATGHHPLRLHRPPRARGPPLRRRQGAIRRRHRTART